MAIIIKDTQFHLKTKNTSYIMGASEKGLMHHYWGAALGDNVDLSYAPWERTFSRPSAQHAPALPDDSAYISDLRYEFSVNGSGDYRTPVLSVVCPDGSTVIEPEYMGYKKISGKPALSGLPAMYAENGDNTETLEIELCDKRTGLKIVLAYTVLADYDVITRSIRYENGGERALRLLSAKSVCVDFPTQDFEIMHLCGDWSCENSIRKEKIARGIFEIDSKRGMSSHMNNPFIALLRDGANEDNGDVYAFSLVYSGSFRAGVEKDSCSGTRVTMGINTANFEWTLESGKTFQTPEVVLVYSGEGIGRMSNIFHKAYRERLCRGKWRDMPRPTLINNWEGTSFDFNEEKLHKIIDNGAKAGLEMFVLDDGWFGKRNNDRSSLGDWVLNRDKLPDGLSALADYANSKGLKFGLWFEPEMISPDSDLYRAHPDWCLHAEGRERTLFRTQLILDLSRNEICDYIVDAVAKVLSSANIEYVKWDCNRNICQTQNMEQTHRYMLGVYSILERLTTMFPDVLFEGCSSGGGRFDPGMLYYMPQTWASDETRPEPRMRIQTGTSMVYPAISMTAHAAAIVTESPCGHRENILNSSALVAMSGNFGLEMDLSLLSEEEVELAKGYVEKYKEIRNTVQFGEMYRLEYGEEKALYSVQYADEEKAVLFTYQARTNANDVRRRVYLKGLDKAAQYECNGQKYFGDELMKFGFNVTLERYEFASNCFVFKKVK